MMTLTIRGKSMKRRKRRKRRRRRRISGSGGVAGARGAAAATAASGRAPPCSGAPRLAAVPSSGRTNRGAVLMSAVPTLLESEGRAALASNGNPK